MITIATPEEKTKERARKLIKILAALSGKRQDIVLIDVLSKYKEILEEEI